MSDPIDSFHPEARPLGEILSNTSPPIRVPDYQRDFSWDQEQITEFWSDLIAFGGNDPAQKLIGKAYFLGASVMVNNGTYHLLLDGQQRLATATILMAALRDKMVEFKGDAATQVQNQFISFQDHLSGERIDKIQLNIFDRAFFRDYIQTFPRPATVIAQKGSHRLIQKAYEYFSEKVKEGWDKAGGGKAGFDWAVHIAMVVREHMVLVTVISNNEREASSIFATLNDRGIGLSTVDLIRSYVLQRAHDSRREEILKHWDEMFNATGKADTAEAVIRMSWVAQHGDVKTRALYRVVVDSIQNDTAAVDYSRRLKEDAVLYRQFRDGDTDDLELQAHWFGLRILKFSAGYPLLIAAHHKLTSDEQKQIAQAVIALVIRHNIVSNQDRGKLESVAYATAKLISDGGTFAAALDELRKTSPSDETFSNGFKTLSFPKSDQPIARYMLRAFDYALGGTGEVAVAGPDKVHVEHIYPQNPPDTDKWPQHESYVNRLGNLTLLDRRLNEQIKNSKFPEKKEKAYKDSRLLITQRLLKLDDWNPSTIEERQKEFGELAQKLWPKGLL